MAKAVEITFAIGAALAGSFAGTFGKAGKALADFQKQAEQMQKQSAQIESYQKMQGAIVKNAVEMQTMYDKAEALNAQAAVSKTRTQELSSQHRTAQQETARLTAENVRNTDAYKAAQLNVKSLENQIANAKQPTAELQRQYKAAQEEVRRLEGAMKGSNEALKAARKNEQDLARQVKESKRETKSLADQSKELTQQGDKLKQTIDRDKESLSRMTAELKAAGIDTRNLASEQARLTQQSQRMAEAQERYKRSKAALDQTKQNLSWNNMKGELMTAAGLGYTLYKPVSQAANFESAMARVNAVAFSGAGRDKEADAKSLQALSEQARQLGRDTQFTAVQAAQSQENLARAGFKADEIISAMPGLLNMAAAEGMDLAAASDIAASTLRGFNMSADQANRVADVLAQTSAASNTNIVGLGEGMKYVAPVAAKLGVSLEETSAMLGVMANAGIKGTEGGTALRGAFLRLAQEPKAVEKALHSLGVASRDAQGNMRKLPDLMTELAEKTKDMGDADRMQKLADIFGVRAVSGMMAVMSGVANGSLETLTQYNKEATGILKAMSEATGASLDEMRAAMKDVEPYTERLGISYRDLAIYTAMLAKSGATGAIANSQLTATFSALADNSKQVQKSLKAYGISLFDDTGEMRDFLEILKDLNNAMKGMDGKKQLEALQKIFKNDEAVLGVQALMAQFEQGAYFELDKVKTKGVSAEMAEKLLETYSGQMTLLGSATEGLMIDIGDVLLPMSKEIVRTITAWTSGLSKLAQEHPEITEAIVGTVGALAALKVGFVGLKIGWNLLKLPFQSLKVAIDFVNLKMLAHGKKAGLLSKVWGGLKSGAKGIGNAFKFVGKGIWGVFKGIGKGMFDVGKLVLLKAKTVAVAIATKAWAASVWLWNLAMKAGSKLLDVGKLALYYGKQILIATATKAWTAAQWLWNAAMTANPIGLIIVAIAGAIAIGYLLYKNWDKLKAWWNSWTIKDVFAVIKDYAFKAWNFVTRKWNEFWTWWDSTTLGDWFRPIKDFAVGVCNSIKGKWNEFSAWWNSWTLPDVFAALGGYVDKIIVKIKDKWQKFKDWLSSLNPFKDWTPPVIAPEVAEAMKAETLQKYGTFDLTPSYMRGQQIPQAENEIKTGTAAKPVQQVSEQEIKRQLENITILNKMSEGFSQRVAEMTQAWQPFKDSLGEGFTQIYTAMQGVADKIRGVVIPAVNELVSALSRVATEISAIVQAGNIEVDVRTPNQGMGSNVPQQYQRMAGGYRKRAEGGIITRPEFALIGEAGREAIIPLEKQTRGTALWLQAGRELGLISDSNTASSVYQNNDTEMMNIISFVRRNSVAGNIANTESSNAESYNAISRIVNALELSNETVNITGSYLARSTSHGYKKSEMLNPIRQPHLGLVAEVGRELGLISESRTSASTYQNVNNISSESVNNVMPSVFDALSVNSQRISQAYDVIPQIVNALKFQHRISNISGDDITSNYSAQTVSELNRTQNYSMMPEIVNAMKIQPQVSNIIPHATGGIFTQPHIGLVAEAGSEAIIPLEDKSRGLPLWMAAGEELGFSFGGSSSNSSMSFTFNPTVSVTVNGGEPDSESKFRRILSEMFEDLFMDFQERMQRVAFE